MTDDIDDLLNDFEKKLNAKDARKWDRTRDDVKEHSANHLKQDSSLNSHLSKRREQLGGLDVSDLLSDDWDDEAVSSCVGKSGSKPAKPATRPAAETNVAAATKKCFPVFIGGTKCEAGLSTTVNKRTCNRLRCTDCDFLVSSFDNFQWLPDTSYLFLRNNMPEYERVRSKLKSKKGYRAYACQCKWLNTAELVDLQTQTDVKWVCGKH